MEVGSSKRRISYRGATNYHPLYRVALQDKDSPKEKEPSDYPMKVTEDDERIDDHERI